MSLIFSALAELDERTRSEASAAPAATTQEPPREPRRWLFGVAAGAGLALVLVSGLYIWAGPESLPPSQAQARASAAVPAAPVQEPSTSESSPLAPYAEPMATTLQPATDTAPAVRVVRDRVLAAASADSSAVQTRLPETSPQASLAAMPSAGMASAELAVSVQPRRSASAPARQADSSVNGAPAPLFAVVERTASDTGMLASRQAADPLPSAVRDAAPVLGSNNSVTVGQTSSLRKDDDIATLANRFNSEMNSGKGVQARATLDRLHKILPERSVTLLRFDAWYAFAEGDPEQARQLYARLLQRLPDDLNAGVNLALIEWRAGEQPAALVRLGKLRIKHPDSALVTRYWNVLQDREQ